MKTTYQLETDAPAPMQWEVYKSIVETAWDLEPLKPEEAADFEEILEDLLPMWIKLWKRLGG